VLLGTSSHDAAQQAHTALQSYRRDTGGVANVVAPAHGQPANRPEANAHHQTRLMQLLAELTVEAMPTASRTHTHTHTCTKEQNSIRMA
jgi:hypothetical protein